MRKIIFYFLICCFVSNCFCQEKFNEITLIEEYKIIDKENSLSIKRMVEKDSIYRNIHLHTIEYYDSNNNIIKKIKRNLCSTLEIGGNLIEYYKNNKVIVSLSENICGIIWRLEISKYNNNGNITEIRQFGFDRIYKTIFDSSMQKKYFNADGNQISDLNMANRENPFYQTCR